MGRDKSKTAVAPDVDLTTDSDIAQIHAALGTSWAPAGNVKG